MVNNSLLRPLFENENVELWRTSFVIKLLSLDAYFQNSALF